MGTVFCDNCGVSLLEETAKFCRACGKPTPSSEEEATTKRFDQQPGFHTPTSPVGPSPTTPAYMAPFEFPAAPQTFDLNRTRKRNVILVASMLAVMILALGGLLIFLNLGQGNPAIIPPSITTPTAPVPPSTPPIPPPPPPPGIETPTKIDESLIYPGSRETMTSTEEGGTRVLSLHSEDATSKVAKWYEARLKVTKRVSIAGQTILEAGDIVVVIMGGNQGAEILITQKQ